MKMIATAAAIALGITFTAAYAQQPKQRGNPDEITAWMKKSWEKVPEWAASKKQDAASWLARIDQDETMKQCSAYDNAPPPAIADAIVAREKATIVYPPDGNFMGDWKKGLAASNNGYGWRFTDYPPRRENGGNCLACHQVTKEEVAYGTLGPTLVGYGKDRKFKAEDVKAVYEKIYNSHAAFPCSTMPRMGANKFLTIEQIKDLVALVMSPDSPVNK